MGTYAVTGRWDGTTFTYDSAVPGALYDPAAETPSTPPSPAVTLSQAELERVAAEVGEGLPGASGAYVDGGRVHVDVTYDDGTLQDWADATYGDGVVVLTSMLVDDSPE